MEDLNRVFQKSIGQAYKEEENRYRVLVMGGKFEGEYTKIPGCTISFKRVSADEEGLSQAKEILETQYIGTVIIVKPGIYEKELVSFVRNEHPYVIPLALRIEAGVAKEYGAIQYDESVYSTREKALKKLARDMEARARSFGPDDEEIKYEDGIDMSLKEIIKKVESYNCKNVCITGGEPLIQKNVYKLINILNKESCKIFIETNGSMDINLIPKYVIRILDIKCPDSGMNKEMDWKNLERLRRDDEIKFVMSSKKDYEWAKRITKKYKLIGKVMVLFGVAHGKLKPKTLAAWILKDKLNVRLQLQLHRIIWPERTRGVK